MRIAAGIGENKNIAEAAEKTDFEVVLVKSEKKLLKMILNNEADAFVRGSLSASSIMKHLRSNYDNPINRTSYLEINNYKFLLAPVGIDEGKTTQEKVVLIDQCCEFLKKMGKKPKIGVLSGGRPQDIGRSLQIDLTIKEAKELTSIIKHKYSIKHYYILIEKAVKDQCNLILAPDGISGNLIFRSLVLLGSGKSHGAITLGIEPIFIDTSRAQSVKGYIRALNFAHYLANIKRQER